MKYAALTLLVNAGNKLTGANSRSGNKVCQFTRRHPQKHLGVLGSAVLRTRCISIPLLRRSGTIARRDTGRQHLRLRVNHGRLSQLQIDHEIESPIDLVKKRCFPSRKHLAKLWQIFEPNLHHVFFHCGASA